MPGENVEAGFRVIDALNSRNLDGVLALMDDDVEFVPRFASLRGRGHDRIRAWWDELLGVLPDFSIEALGYRELGDATVGRLRFSGHGSGSGTPFDETIWITTRWRSGKCVWWSNHATESEALQAAGLSE